MRKAGLLLIIVFLPQVLFGAGTSDTALSEAEVLLEQGEYQRLAEKILESQLAQDELADTAVGIVDTTTDVYTQYQDTLDSFISAYAEFYSLEQRRIEIFSQDPTSEEIETIEDQQDGLIEQLGDIARDLRGVLELEGTAGYINSVTLLDDQRRFNDFTQTVSQLLAQNRFEDAVAEIINQGFSFQRLEFSQRGYNELQANTVIDARENLVQILSDFADQGYELRLAADRYNAAMDSLQVTDDSQDFALDQATGDFITRSEQIWTLISAFETEVQTLREFQENNINQIRDFVQADAEPHVQYLIALVTGEYRSTTIPSVLGHTQGEQEYAYSLVQNSFDTLWNQLSQSLAESLEQEQWAEAAQTLSSSQIALDTWARTRAQAQPPPERTVIDFTEAYSAEAHGDIPDGENQRRITVQLASQALSFEPLETRLAQVNGQADLAFGDFQGTVEFIDEVLTLHSDVTAARQDFDQLLDSISGAGGPLSPVANRITSTVDTLSTEYLGESLALAEESLVALAAGYLDQGDQLFDQYDQVAEENDQYLLNQELADQNVNRRPDLASANALPILEELDQRQEIYDRLVEILELSDQRLLNLDSIQSLDERLQSSRDRLAQLDQRFDQQQADAQLYLDNYQELRSSSLAGFDRAESTAEAAQTFAAISQAQAILDQAVFDAGQALANYNDPEFSQLYLDLQANLTVSITEARNQIVREEYLALYNEALEFYGDRRYDDALIVLEEAEDVYNAVFNPDLVSAPSPLIQSLKTRIEALTTLSRDLELTRTDPYYFNVIELLNNAEVQVAAATQLTNEGDDEQAVFVIELARENLEAIGLYKPNNTRARILELRVLQLTATDPAQFNALLNGLYQDALDNQNPTERLSELRSLYEIQPRSDIQSSIIQTEIALGIRENPLVAQQRSRSNQLYQVALATYNQAVTNDNNPVLLNRALSEVEEALAVYPENIAANNLQSDILIATGQTATVSISANDRVLLARAQDLFVRGDDIGALEILETLRENPANAGFGEIVSLYNRIIGQN